MYLLDTNVLMHLANRTAGHEQIREKLKSLRKSDFAISAITAIELWQKTLTPTAPKRGREELAALLNALRILPFKGDAAGYGGLLLQQTREKGKPVGWPDTMLAAHALALDATVVTDNTKDFVRSGCRLENWRA
jgi:tRNA(fMet)-specific endonuclease VapC